MSPACATCPCVTSTCIICEKKILFSGNNVTRSTELSINNMEMYNRYWLRSANKITFKHVEWVSPRMIIICAVRFACNQSSIELFSVRHHLNKFWKTRRKFVHATGTPLSDAWSPSMVSAEKRPPMSVNGEERQQHGGIPIAQWKTIILRFSCKAICHRSANRANNHILWDINGGIRDILIGFLQHLTCRYWHVCDSEVT